MEAPQQRSISRSIIAAALGAIVMAAAVVGISLNANAGSINNSADQASGATIPPTTTAPGDTPAAAPETTAMAFGDEDFADDYEEPYPEYVLCMEESGIYAELEVMDEEDYEAMDAAWAEVDAECSLLLPEEVQIENAAWIAHSECVEEMLGSEFWDSEQAIDEALYRDADRACRSVLPEHLQEEAAAWDAHSDCLREIFGDAFYGDGDTVSYSTMNDYESYLLGEGDSTITITKTDGQVTVTVDGDVIVQDEDYWAAEDARWMEGEQACEHLIPSHEEG